MSEYTLSVKNLVLSMTKDMAGHPISDRVRAACPKIFSFDYDLWSEDYKPILEKKILMRYFNREIGLETVGLWKLYLEERMNAILPYYNELYKSILTDYDITESTSMNESVKITETEDEDRNLSRNTDTSSTTTREGTSRYSDTASSDQTTNATVDESRSGHALNSDLPQANYAGVDYGTDSAETSETLDRTENQTIDATQSGSGDQTTNDTGTATGEQKTTDDESTDKKREYQEKRHQSGNNVPIADLIMRYRKTLINIDEMVVREFADLFMTIY